MQKVQQNAVIGKTELYLAWQVQHANAQTLILLGSVILPSIFKSFYLRLVCWCGILDLSNQILVQLIRAQTNFIQDFEAT
jgi:hypothetical protein